VRGKQPQANAATLEHRGNGKSGWKCALNAAFCV
jgi:hypothetical protein